jgi:hypothetical protein
MLAGGPMALTAMLLIQASAEFETGARLEARVGSFPSAGQQSGTRVQAVATPRLRLDWLAGTDALSADLSSRILWRPVPLYHQRPLFLETLSLAHRARPTRRSEWGLALQASYGEQDYTSLSQQLEDQPTLPLATTMLMVGGTAGLSWRASRRVGLSVSLGANHRRTIDTRDGEASSSFYSLPTQTTVSVAPALQLSVSRRVALSVSVPLSDSDIRWNRSGLVPGAHLNMLSVQPQLGVSGPMTRRHRLQVAAGMTYARPLLEGATSTGARVSPLGNISLGSELYRSASTMLGSTVSTGVTWMMDPVLGSGRLRWVTSVGLSSQMGRQWSAGVRASFVTDLSKPPEGSRPIDWTMLSTDCSVTYRWPYVLVAEFGGRFAERGPRLGSPGFEWRGRELWGFVSLSSASRTTLTGLRGPRSAIGR